MVNECMTAVLIDAGVTGIVIGPKTRAMLDAVETALSPTPTDTKDTSR